MLCQGAVVSCLTVGDEEGALFQLPMIGTLDTEDLGRT